MNVVEDEDVGVRIQDVQERYIWVSNAGNAQVNGRYERDGFYQGVAKYSRNGWYRGQRCKYWLYMDRVSSWSREWFISAIPNGVEPGTDPDLDFYFVPVTEENEKVPSSVGWHTCYDQVLLPPPTITFARREDDNEQALNVRVSNAGCSEINGLYEREGFSQGVVKYSRFGIFRGQQRKFSLYKCYVWHTIYYWYISLIPEFGMPGTGMDIDFYCARVTEESENLPPSGGWYKNINRRNANPAPTLTFERGESRFERRVNEREPILRDPPQIPTLGQNNPQMFRSPRT